MASVLVFLFQICQTCAMWYRIQCFFRVISFYFRRRNIYLLLTSSLEASIYFWTISYVVVKVIIIGDNFNYCLIINSMIAIDCCRHSNRQCDTRYWFCIQQKEQQRTVKQQDEYLNYNLKYMVDNCLACKMFYGLKGIYFCSLQ